MWNLLPSFKSKTVKQNELEINDATIPMKFNSDQFVKFHKKIKQLQIVFKQAYDVQEKDQRVIKLFADLIETLEGLLGVVSALSAQYKTQMQKIEDYDKIKVKLSNHTSIIHNIQQEHQDQLNRLYEEHSKKEQSFQFTIQILKKQLSESQAQVKILTQKISQFSLKTEDLNKLVKKNEQSLRENEKQFKQLSKKNELYKQSFQNGSNVVPVLVDMENIKLESLLYYSKFRNYLIPYLGSKDLISLSMTTKPLHFIFINKIIPKQMFKKTQSFYQKKIKKIQNDIQYYQKVYDNFNGENIKVNAIKYLFFKTKPGPYILTMLQDDIGKYEDPYGEQALGVSNQQITKNKQSSWKNIFKSGKVQEKQKQSNLQKFSLTSLKNSQQFKQISKKITEYFQKNFYSFSFPNDLHNFTKVMEQQLLQLKASLHDLSSETCTLIEWTSRLVTLSKFLYLQSNQIWSLLHVTFGMLLQSQIQCRSMNEQLQDLRESQSGLRRLVEQLAKSKNQMEKRQWLTQTQILNQKQKKVLQQQELQQKSVQLQKLYKINNQLTQELHNQKHKTKILSQKCQQIQETRNQQLQNLILLSNELRKLQLGD